jgi:Glycosyl transferase family 2
MDVRRKTVAQPFFSICIPQYNRTSFLIESCRLLDEQQTRNFELCISDDCSTDGREAELLQALHSSQLSFVYRRTQTNQRYDGNLRSAIALASAPYCFLLGNDDALSDPQTLGDLEQAIRASDDPSVVFTNFADFTTGRVTERVKKDGLIGSGPLVAASAFRKFSFVSGVVLKTAPVHALSTTRWDGSEMYQMYVGSRLIAQGGRLLELARVAVRKDIAIAGESVDSYAKKPAGSSWSIPERRIPLVTNAALVIDAIEPYAGDQRLRVQVNVLMQFFGVLYPYWLVEYRRVQSWGFAVGVARAMRPSRSLAGVQLTLMARMFAWLTFIVSTIAGLTVPVSLFGRLIAPFRRVARTVSDTGMLKQSFRSS